MRRITKAAFGGLAGCALILGGTQVASGAISEISKIRAWAEDLMLLNEGPLDSAKAKITIAEGTDSTTFTIRVTGMGTSAAGTVLGAHLHTGPCIEGQGTAAGPHYNQQVVVGGRSFAEAEISPNTEVWFDLEANDEGMAYDETTVKFVPVAPPDGKMSVVVHVMSTNTDPANGTIGYAGARQACFPVSVPQWIPTASPSPSPTE